jgi:hypothetical protein
VSAVSSDTLPGNYVIKYTINGRTRTIQSTTDLVEPLCYPLLFPYGERGWSIDLQKLRSKINYMPYLASRILMPESGLNVKNQNAELINVNRFQIMSRLMQYYVVESVSRAIDYRLEWMRNHQSTIIPSTIYGEEQTEVNEMVDSDNDENNMNEQNDDEIIDQERITNSNSNKTYLAESFTGSPRHLRSNAIDAMTIVSELGESTAFVTATFNPKWPELKEKLIEGQQIYDRPDIACIVFKARLSALIHNIKHGKYFGGRKTVYFLYVIEYQFRGLPHAHLVFRLHNAPTTDAEKLSFIQTYFKAQYPEFNKVTELELDMMSNVETESYNKKLEEHELYEQYINNNMTHTCSSSINGCLDKNNLCKRGYMTLSVNNAASFDTKGYPVYYRPNIKDLKVVPHNKEMLMDWNGHINVEFCGKTYAVLYLYNYLFKGIIYFINKLKLLYI